MEILQYLLTDPKPLETYSLLGLLMNIWKQYQAEPQGRAGYGLQVYEVDPLICEKCGHEMKLIAVITDPYEVQKILECLKRNKAPPFDKVALKDS
jgi:hypothetical protein